MDIKMDSMKRQIKENIQQLVAKGNLTNAKELLKQYRTIIKDDLDVYSIEAVICIMQGNLEEAEKIINMGLEIEQYNKDLLYNLSYIMDGIDKKNKAIEYFCLAKLFNPGCNEKIEDIISKIKPLNSNLKVVHGTMEIANQMNIMAEGLKKLGVDVKTINYYPSYLGYKSDYILNLSSFKNINEANIETKKLASKIIAENNVFHFHFGTSLVLDNIDLPLLKELGKKVVMQYWGSDVRMYSKAIKMNPYIKVKNTDEEAIKRRLDTISKYVDDCLVDYELAEYVKGYHKSIHYTRVAIDLDKYKCTGEFHNKKLLIVHAPTSPEIKGTKYILKAIEELKSNYDFDFKLVQGMPHEEAAKIYKKADIIIDQLLVGGYGVFAVESMAMGKPVICWISDFMKDCYPKGLPIISANPDNIKERIEYVIKNKDMLSGIGFESRKYVEKYHDFNAISKNILDIYKEL